MTYQPDDIEGLIQMTVRLLKMTYLLDRCARCLADCAAVESLEIDPLCTACIAELAANINFASIRHNDLNELRDALYLTQRSILAYAACTICGICPCPIPRSLDVDPICACCLALNADHPDYRPCPGYRVPECGNPLPEGDDLCGDCLMARLDAESPR